MLTKAPDTEIPDTEALDPEPAVYRSSRPIWADGSFAGIAGKIHSNSILAALRNATPGSPVEDSGVPPFSCGPYTFVHNGVIEHFRQSAMRHLRASLSDEAYSNILGVTDSETIFAGLLDRLDGRRRGAEALAEAVEAELRHLTTVCAGLGIEAALNLAVTDGEAMVASRYSLRGPGNSLYFLVSGTSFPGGVVVASERLDGDEDWTEVPDGHLLLAEMGGGAELRKIQRTE